MNPQRNHPTRPRQRDTFGAGPRLSSPSPRLQPRPGEGGRGVTWRYSRADSSAALTPAALTPTHSRGEREPDGCRVVRARALGVALAALLLVAPPAMGQDDAALDELLNIPTRQTPAPPAEEAPREAANGDEAAGGEQLQPGVRRLVEEGDAADMLDAALRQMEDVSARLGERLDAGLDTQREQESILRKLDQVIAAARQQQESNSSSSSGSGGGGQQPRQQDIGGRSVAAQQAGSQGQPGAEQSGAEQAGAGENRGETGVGGRPPGDPRTEPLEEIRKEWGNLPPRLRDELTEGLSEEFSPAYRELTEQYYRALAEDE